MATGIQMALVRECGNLILRDDIRSLLLEKHFSVGNGEVKSRSNFPDAVSMKLVVTGKQARPLVRKKGKIVQRSLVSLICHYPHKGDCRMIWDDDEKHYWTFPLGVIPMPGNEILNACGVLIPGMRMREDLLVHKRDICSAVKIVGRAYRALKAAGFVHGNYELSITLWQCPDTGAFTIQTLNIAEKF